MFCSGESAWSSRWGAPEQIPEGRTVGAPRLKCCLCQGLEERRAGTEQVARGCLLWLQGVLDSRADPRARLVGLAPGPGGGNAVRAELTLWWWRRGAGGEGRGRETGRGRERGRGRRGEQRKGGGGGEGKGGRDRVGQGSPEILWPEQVGEWWHCACCCGEAWEQGQSGLGEMWGGSRWEPFAA